MFDRVLKKPLQQVPRNCQKTNQTLGRYLIFNICTPRKCRKTQNKGKFLFFVFYSVVEVGITPCATFILL